MRTVTSGQRMADRTALRADLTKAGRAEIPRIHRDHRRAFRASVPFERTYAEVVFERLRQPLRKFFRARDDHLHAAEFLGRATAQVRLQKGRCGQQKRDPIFPGAIAPMAAKSSGFG